MIKNLLYIQEMFNKDYNFDNMKKDAEKRVEKIILDLGESNRLIARYSSTQLLFNKYKEINIIFEIVEDEEQDIAEYIIVITYDKNGQFNKDIVK